MAQIDIKITEANFNGLMSMLKSSAKKYSIGDKVHFLDLNNNWLEGTIESFPTWYDAIIKTKNHNVSVLLLHIDICEKIQIYIK